MTTVRRCLPAAAALSAVVLLPVLSAAPAAALYRDEGDDPGGRLSTLEVLALYVGAPLLLLAIIGVAVYAPTLVEGPRYRPGWAWWHEPVWFGGSAGDEMHRVDEGADTAADAVVGAEPGPETTGGGGTSARW